MKELIKEYCKQLRWGNSLVKNYSSIEADTHEEFLAKLLEMELKTREVHRKNRCLRQASFDVIKTFNGYSLDHIEIPVSIPIDDLKTAAFLERKENLILYGPVGTGNYRKYLVMERISTNSRQSYGHCRKSFHNIDVI